MANMMVMVFLNSKNFGMLESLKLAKGMEEDVWNG